MCTFTFYVPTSHPDLVPFFPCLAFGRERTQKTRVLVAVRRENGECAGWQGANFTNGYRPKAFTAPPSSCNNNARLNVSNDGNILVCATELLFWLPSESQKALHQSDKHIFKCTYVYVSLALFCCLLAPKRDSDVGKHIKMLWRMTVFNGDILFRWYSRNNSVQLANADRFSLNSVFVVPLPRAATNQHTLR